MEELVRYSVLFRSLDDEAAEALRASMYEVRFRQGAVVFTEGDPGDSVYLVVSGQIKLARTGAGRRESLLAVLGPSQVFGELSLIDLGQRDATATALTDLAMLQLSHPDLDRWLNERPIITLGLLTQLARRLRRANDVVGDLVFADVPTRVARTLVDLTARFSVDVPPDPEHPSDPAGAVRVEHGLTQTDLAQLVGAARETVNKSLATFVARGWIRLEQRAVIVLDSAALQERAR